MGAKVEQLERGYSAIMIGCWAIGLLVMVFCLIVVTVFEILGASQMALTIPDGAAILRSIVRLLVFGMMPALGVTFLVTAYTMQKYRKGIRIALAKSE